MSSFARKYALCHLCPGKWLRKDIIPAGTTVEEACGAHNEEELERHWKNELMWNDEQVLKLTKAREQAEREENKIEA